MGSAVFFSYVRKILSLINESVILLLHVKLSTSCPLLSPKSILYFANFQLTSPIKPPDPPSYRSHVFFPLLTLYQRIQLNPDVTVRNMLLLFRGELLLRRPTTTLQHFGRQNTFPGGNSISRSLCPLAGVVSLPLTQRWFCLQRGVEAVAVPRETCPSNAVPSVQNMTVWSSLLDFVSWGKLGNILLVLKHIITQPIRWTLFH